MNPREVQRQREEIASARRNLERGVRLGLGADWIRRRRWALQIAQEQLDAVLRAEAG